MSVTGLNHVNIVTDDVERSVRFYEAVLGMEARPVAVMPDSPGRWIYDESGDAIMHIQAYNPARHGELPERMTGSIDHVALTCSGFDEMVERCKSLGVDHKTNETFAGNFRQIFVTDPDNVLLELNFPDG